MFEKKKIMATKGGIRISLKGNASIADQKAWSLMPKSMRSHLSKQLKNADGDSRPDGYDCHILDKLRQESFLPSDQAYVKNLRSVELGKFLSHGGAGNVNIVKGKPDFIVKTPVTTKDKHYSARREGGFEGERRFYKKHNLLEEPLFIPTKEVKVGNKTGLLRPTITIISEPNNRISRKITSKVTDKQLATIRQKLIALSMKGYTFFDGLQIGIDKSGRPLAYDCGELEIKSASTAFRYNNGMWVEFLYDIGRISENDRYTGNPGKYGYIKRGA